MLTALGTLPFAFAYGMGESEIEALLNFLCVHRRVAANRLPPFLPWICAVKEASDLSHELEKAASVVRRPIRAVRDVRLLTLTDDPWGHAYQAVLETSALWRRATNDGGCG